MRKRPLKAWAQDLTQLPLPLVNMPVKADDVKQSREPVQRQRKLSVVARRLPGLE